MVPLPDPMWSPETAQAIDAACDRFEQAWRSEQPPEIEPYLRGVDSEQRAALFRELLHLEAHYRSKLGQTPLASDYTERFPDLSEIVTEILPSASIGATLSLNATLEETLAPPAPPTSPTITTVPGYEILGTLGRGGMGVVYKAKQLGLRRLVALKMILSGEHAGAQERERFLLEAQAIARLRHPNIVQIFEVGEHAGRPFFSMEFCEGGGLDRRLRGQPLHQREAAELVAWLAVAVQLAHSAGIVHRDLKPANILLVRKPGILATEEPGPLSDFEPRVTDFGLAKLSGDQKLSATGAIVGTPSYMAPEQAEGKSDVGPRADVWALGAILYECLVGRPPFRAATPLDTIRQVILDEPVPPCRLDRRIHKDLESVALKCLAKNPAHRYGSAAELAEDLQRWLTGLPTRARPVGTMETVRRWAVRRPTLAALVGVSILATLLLLAGALYASWAIGASRGEAALAESRRRDAEYKANADRDVADTAQFHALVGQAREQRINAAPGWRRAALGYLREAAQILRPAEANQAMLTSDLAANLLGHDAELVGELVPGFDSSRSVWRPGTKEVVLAQTRQMGLGNCRVLLVDAVSGKTLRELSYPPRIQFSLTTKPKLDGTESLAISRDGRWLAAGSRNGNVWVWDLNETTPRAKFAFADAVQSLAFDVDGRTLLGSKTGVGAILVSYDVVAGKELASRKYAMEDVNAISVDPRGGRFTLRLASRIEHLCSRTLAPVALSLPSQGVPAYSPDGRILVVWHREEVWLQSAETIDGSRIATLRSPGLETAHPVTANKAVIGSAHFSPDGSLLLTVSESGQQARLWDVAGGRFLLALATDGPISGASFASDSRRFLLHVGGKALLYAVTGTEFQRQVEQVAAPIESFAMSPKGDLAILSSSCFNEAESQLSCWSATEPVSLRTRIVGSNMGILFRSPALACNPVDGRITFTRTTPPRIVQWSGAARDPLPGEPWRDDPQGLHYNAQGQLWVQSDPLGVLGGPRWQNNLLAITRIPSSMVPGRTHVLTGWREGMIRLHGPDAQPLRAWEPSSSAVRSLALAPGEELAAAGTDQGTIFLFRVPSLEPAGEFPATDRHHDRVTGLLFLGPRLFLSTGRDGYLALWEIEVQPRLVFRVRLSRPIQQMAGRQDGRQIGLVLAGERVVRLLDLRALLQTLLTELGSDIVSRLPAELPAAPAPGPLPPFVGVEPPAGRHGLRTEIYADPWFEHRVKVRHDETIWYDWGERFPDTAVPGPEFSVRWTGWIMPPEKGKYRLWVRGSGKVWVSKSQRDSRLRAWTESSEQRDENFEFTGDPIWIRLDYAKTGTQASFHLEWSPEDDHNKRSRVPAEWLFPTAKKDN